MSLPNDFWLIAGPIKIFAIHLNDGGFTSHLLVFKTGDVPHLGPGATGYSEGSSAILRSSAHCMEVSSVPKQWHRNIQGEPALV